MSIFNKLVTQLARTQDNRPPSGLNKTGTLMHVINETPGIRTADLCKKSGLDSKIVWGLLKYQIKSGRLTCKDGQWSPCDEHEAKQISAAAEFLRGRGWTCHAPEVQS